LTATFSRIVLGILLLALAPAIRAHHSFAAEFDAFHPIVLRGRVTKIAWVNPHVYLWIDAADENGEIVNWTVESVAPNYLQRLGWTKLTVKAGDILTIRAFPAKDRARLAKTDAITLPDGRLVTTGRADDAPPK